MTDSPHTTYAPPPVTAAKAVELEKPDKETVTLTGDEMKLALNALQYGQASGIYGSTAKVVDGDTVVLKLNRPSVDGHLDASVKLPKFFEVEKV